MTDPSKSNLGFQKGEEDYRKDKFKRNKHLEELLREINSLLWCAEEQAIKNYRMPKHPVIFVVGSPRCGTTLTMQWLANTGSFSYPTNLLSRFYGAPYLGAKIQRLITDKKYDFNHELFDFDHPVEYRSDIGKTKGALSPNEFWYFWRRFFPYGEIQYLDRTSLRKVDRSKFAAELAAIEAAFGKPFALKAGIVNLNISFVSEMLEKAFFIYIKRHPLYNVQSVLEARERQLGTRKYWYSFKPREYDRLKKLSPIEQVAGQVYYLNRGIEAELIKIDKDRYLEITYEDLCFSPPEMYSRVKEKLKIQGCKIKSRYKGQSQFSSSNRIRLSGEEIEQIIEAWEKFSGERLRP